MNKDDTFNDRLVVSPVLALADIVCEASRQMDVFLFWAETVQTANTNSNVDKITLLIIFWNFIYSKNTCFVLKHRQR